jgi:hypothetical protein
MRLKRFRLEKGPYNIGRPVKKPLGKPHYCYALGWHINFERHYIIDEKYLVKGKRTVSLKNLPV